MNVAEDTELELRPTKYPNLRVATGGKGPPDDPTLPQENWLSELPVGATFVARERSMKQLDYNLYHVLFKSGKVTLLTWKLPDGKLLDCYVDPQRFSNRMELGEVLGIETEVEQPPKEIANDPDNDGHPNYE